MNTHVRLYVIRLVWIMMLMANAVGAEVPPMMNYQGYLTDSAGIPLNETVEMEFSLYDEEIGGTALWTESQSSIVVSKGIYHVILGSSKPLTLPFDVPYYLGIRVNGEEMSPRRPLLSVPYALRAKSVVNATSVVSPFAYSSGLVGISSFADCVIEDEENGRNCQYKTNIGVSLTRNSSVSMDLVPEDLEEIIRVEVYRNGNSIEITLLKASDSLSFVLSLAAPTYAVKHDPNFSVELKKKFNVRASLLTDSLVVLTADAATVKIISTISQGIILATAVSFPGGAHHAQVAVTIQNVGDFKTNYHVNVTDCAACDGLVVSQSTILDSGATAILTFDLYSADGFTAGATCLVSLMSPNGKTYDSLVVTIE